MVDSKKWGLLFTLGLVVFLIIGIISFSNINNNALTGGTVVEIDIDSSTSASCKDSDFNNQFESGKVIVINDEGVSKGYIDHCLTESKVLEFVCESNLISSEEIECDFGCVAGICRQS
jgi:hypothetical protein